MLTRQHKLAIKVIQIFMFRKEHIYLNRIGSKTAISLVSDIVAISKTDICAREVAMNVTDLHIKSEESLMLTPNTARGQIIRPATQRKQRSVTASALKILEFEQRRSFGFKRTMRDKVLPIVPKAIRQGIPIRNKYKYILYSTNWSKTAIFI
jgi:hypothetical protein